MAFLDEVTITAKAGKGGDGVVRWRREKFIARFHRSMKEFLV